MGLMPRLGGAFRLQGAGNELFTGGFGAKR